MDKIKFQSFGKVKISNGSAKNKELDELYRLKSIAVFKENDAEINEIDNKIRNEINSMLIALV